MSSHLSESAVGRYIQSRMSPLERDTAERHTIECDDCMDHIVAAALSLHCGPHISTLLAEDDVS